MTNRLHILSFKMLGREVHAEAEKLNARINEIEPIRLLPEFNDVAVIEAINTNDALLFTSPESANAIKSFLDINLLRNKKIYCVGNRLSNFFKDLGINTIERNNMGEIGETIAGNNHKQLAYFHGNRTINTIDKIVGETDTALTRIQVYRNELLYPKVKDLTAFQLYWCFSPSGVESFLKHNAFPNNAFIAAIGNTTSAQIENRKVFVASKPDAMTLLKESINHYRKYGGN